MNENKERKQIYIQNTIIIELFNKWKRLRREKLV